MIRTNVLRSPRRVLYILNGLLWLLSTQLAASTSAVFLPPELYITGSGHLNFGTKAVAVADVNGDGKQDLILLPGGIRAAGDPNASDRSVAVLLGNGDGTFQPTITYDSGGSLPWSVAAADVNGDHMPDLVVAHYCEVDANNTCSSGRGFVTVLLGSGDGTFQTPTRVDSGGFNALSVAVADVNGDARPDIVVGNNATDAFTPFGIVAVLMGNGDGTFQSAVTHDSGAMSANSIAVSDVNGDHNLDLLVSNQCASPEDCTRGLLGVLLGNGDGTFRPVVIYDSGGFNSASIAVGDVNHDAKPDLVAYNVCDAGANPNGGSNCTSGFIGVLLGNGDGTFQPAVGYGAGGAGGNIGSVALADVNGDGSTDVVDVNLSPFGAGRVGVLLGNGDGTFQKVTNYDAGGSATFSLAVADLNADALPDVVVSECDLSGCAGADFAGVLLNATDTTPPAITLAANQGILWPPNGRMVPVILSGRITDASSGVDARSAMFAVNDEYGEIKPSGPVLLDAAGNFSFTVLLEASRRGSDLDGRRYVIVVRARDIAGNLGSREIVVSVPHDHRPF